MGTIKSEELSASKKKIRSTIRRLLESLPKDQGRQCSAELTVRLLDFLNTPRFSSLKYLGGFAPMASEPNWIARAEDFESFQTAYPGIVDEKMVFLAARFRELETRSDFGVELKLPKSTAQVVTPDVLLVPGLAFTKDGTRLGRGGGYYDRYLEGYQGIKIGLCFEIQIQQEIPAEEHDQKMDWVITDKNLYGG